MNFIKVVVYGSREGRFSYRILTENTRLAAPLEGLSATPLLDACCRLKELGAAPDDALVATFDDDSKSGEQFRAKTTVGYGARVTVSETATSGPKFVPRGPPMTPEEKARARTPAPVKDALKSSEGTETAPEAQNAPSGEKGTEETAIHSSGAKSARSEAAPPPRSKPPASPAGRDQDLPRPPKPGPTPHKRKPAKSGGRRGQR